MSNENTVGYSSGADFFRDTAVSHGTEEALGICGRYLGTQLTMEQPNDERQFCRELFAAMCEAAAERTDPAKLVYPYDFSIAKERMETSYYHESRKHNDACAHAIDKAIHASCYKTNYYNLELAAMKAVHDFGFNRVNLVLAHNFQQREHDGRFSTANKKWAREINVIDKAFSGAILNAHPILIEDFATYARKLYDAVGADRFILPGRPESGDTHNGYEIVRAICFDDLSGFAIGINPDASDTFAAWRFQVEEYGRDFFWRKDSNDFGSVAQDYIARIMVHMDGGNMKEIPNHLAAAEMRSEQNYNMIDGLRNNEAVPPADLTDGQTYEEIRELAPETLPGEKPSVVEQIKAARQAPQQPGKDAPQKHKSKGGPEL